MQFGMQWRRVDAERRIGSRRRIALDNLFPCRMKRRSVQNQPSLARRAARMLQKLEGVRGLSVEEKSVHALGLAATPDERWEIFESFIRSAGYWQPCKRKKSPSC